MRYVLDALVRNSPLCPCPQAVNHHNWGGTSVLSHRIFVRISCHFDRSLGGRLRTETDRQRETMLRAGSVLRGGDGVCGVVQRWVPPQTGRQSVQATVRPRRHELVRRARHRPVLCRARTVPSRTHGAVQSRARAVYPLYICPVRTSFSRAVSLGRVRAVRRRTRAVLPPTLTVPCRTCADLFAVIVPTHTLLCSSSSRRKATVRWPSAAERSSSFAFSASFASSNSPNTLRYRHDTTRQRLTCARK